jgi:hypothetical protein
MVTDQGDQIMFYKAPTKVTYYLVTDTGDFLVTDEGDNIVVIIGDAGPGYYKTADVTQDGDEGFNLLFQTNPWQPEAQGGECVFSWLFLSVSWSMAALLRVTPMVDGKPITETMDDGTIVRTIRSLITLDQQEGTLQRENQVFPIPIALEYEKDGTVFTRTAMRGQRFQMLVESIGNLGVGEIMITGAEVTYESVRKANYAEVDSSGS